MHQKGSSKGRTSTPSGEGQEKKVLIRGEKNLGQKLCVEISLGEVPDDSKVLKMKGFEVYRVRSTIRVYNEPHHPTMECIAAIVGCGGVKFLTQEKSRRTTAYPDSLPVYWLVSRGDYAKYLEKKTNPDNFWSK